MTTIRPSTVLAWLAGHLDWIAHRPEAVVAFDELAQVKPLLLACIDTAPDVVYAGPCDRCGRDLYAVRGAITVTCTRGCGWECDLRTRRDWLLDQVEDQLATATEIARAVTSLGDPVTPERIRQWASRPPHRLATRGQDRRGHPLYRVGDVLDMLHA